MVIVSKEPMKISFSKGIIIGKRVFFEGEGVGGGAGERG